VFLLFYIKVLYLVEKRNDCPVPSKHCKSENNLLVVSQSQNVTQCLRRVLFSQTINGKVIDLNKKAGNADYVQGGCGVAGTSNHCKLGSKCLDNYNVHKCDCSLTPFYGYFCSKGMIFCCFSGVQHLFVDGVP